MALDPDVPAPGEDTTAESTDTLSSELRAEGVVFGEIMPMEELEQKYILHVLERMGGNRTHTARALGIGANTLWRKLKAWGVPPARSAD